MKWALKKAQPNEEKKLFNESRNSTQSAEHEAHTHTHQTIEICYQCTSLLDINPSQLEVGRLKVWRKIETRIELWTAAHNPHRKYVCLAMNTEYEIQNVAAKHLSPLKSRQKSVKIDAFTEEANSAKIHKQTFTFQVARNERKKKKKNRRKGECDTIFGYLDFSISCIKNSMENV